MMRTCMYLLCLLCCLSTTHGLGGEKAAYQITPLSSSQISHRQHVCDRYDRYRAGEIELKDALSGLSLKPMLTIEESRSSNFKYSHEEGIDKDNPGIIVELFDAIAERANFTWRASFGVTEVAGTYNLTWTELLHWSIENYDISINDWDHSAERMAMGVTYTVPWYDGSLILIDRRKSNNDGTNTINPLNWTKPFEPAVWGMIILTVIISAMVYQLIEYLNGEQEERSLYQWFSDNLYLSAINFSQNFEYAPNSFAGRIFGVSMTLWALVITATYTANLASLFVEARVDPGLVESMEEAVVFGYPVCTYENTNSDFYIRETFPKANRKPREDDMVSLESLRNGECALAVIGKDTWLTKQLDEDYNPNCDLEWIGDTVKVVDAGFAVVADVGFKCSSLVRHVVNLHLTSLIEEGVMAAIWNKYRELEDDGHCQYEDDSNVQSRRQLRFHESQKPKSRHRGAGPDKKHRILKSGGLASSGSDTGDNIDADTLTLQQMAGTFLVHYGAMAVAVIVSFITVYAEKKNWFHCADQVKVMNRMHGPIIGMPPRANTFVVRNRRDRRDNDLDISHFSHNTGNGTRVVRNRRDDALDISYSSHCQQERARFSPENEYTELVAKQTALETKIDEMNEVNRKRLAEMDRKFTEMGRHQIVLGAKMDRLLELLHYPGVQDTYAL
ncbi:receptor ionotropic, NMDA 1 [Seminavis robusta]|uniref:Receptor ionotropic, NMDA 1 n=1 Tax=Seminavis robusta TaxID=568900 RepID=A0A9N8HPM7_9STRA|nr:receptor ionotropic, NMDA 1 [Seminavis robusta]|eukprot:Sro1106_g241960.1 receptor ionotropic, NMDA 1 (673) ;mRNA; r:3640-5658